MNYSVFLRWMLMASIFIVGVIISSTLGLLGDMYNLDSTKLSLVIAGVFVLMTGWCGVKTFIANKCLNDLEENRSKIAIKNKIDDLDSKQEIGWFMSDMFLAVGMIGTIIGFMMMLSGFAAIDPSNTVGMKAILFSMSSGMSTALITTLVGLICSILLKFQYMNLSGVIETIKGKLEKKK